MHAIPGATYTNPNLYRYLSGISGSREGIRFVLREKWDHCRIVGENFGVPSPVNFIHPSILGWCLVDAVVEESEELTRIILNARPTVLEIVNTCLEQQPGLDSSV